eukprot:Gregarina_sp_Poly_1__6177@NODE_326_length_9503_cov_249_815388_g278_i0_p5_GENE_NODE_326_length_9503_cov_249_815388_g278_i0NODE_326_length_9503_cov_249_815388_g278_i0_p5_ORF_typecomplete_len161_score21_36Histone/PF00125_24/8_5e12TFIID18kDa/PF02269_16/0_0066TFIID18kDa/PF02269_16/1_6e02TFIID_20kDa/PF03847_13/0_12DUF3408/PF11888_8/0_086_NODE_326_length_9503_cov_249_815388_g278_i051935675
MAKSGVISKAARKRVDSPTTFKSSKTTKSVPRKNENSNVVQPMDEKVEDEKKKTKKDTKTINFHSVIFRVFKQVRGEATTKISKDTVHVLNTIVHDLVSRLGEEGGRLCKYTGHNTMKLRDLHTAVRLVINTRELSTLMCAGGDDAVKRHFQSKRLEVPK